MMMEYRLVTQFNFNNKKYQLLIDRKNKLFFLEVNPDNSFSYITDKELIMLHNLFRRVPHVMYFAKDKKSTPKILRIIPKVIAGGVLVPLTLVVLLNACNQFHSVYLDNYYEKHGSVQEEIQIDRDLSFEVVDSSEPLTIDTIIESEWLGYLNIYDMQYLDKALDYQSVTIDQINDRITNNPKISERFKALLKEYVQMVHQKYPNAELRVLYENLATLEVVECTKNELLLASLSTDSAGCYIRTENKIYVLEEYEYKKGTWEYQVIMHEFGHALRTGYWQKNDKQIRVQSQGSNFNITTTEEALNSLFTVSLFDYEEKDIAYQLQSNYYSIIVECLDNYTLEDYVNHSTSYFIKAIDEQLGYTNYASVIAQLIETQRNDFLSDRMEISQDQYRPIYEVICELFFTKYITPDMSYEEAKICTNILVERILYDVPVEYNIETSYFYDLLNEYCLEIGIAKELSK
ncbi:MAG: hypothetical protein IJO63_05685 [Bacilli bacterium]|nr:hypothetical protein [Bacilli bacterium]